ncbi:hypothetical protein J6590_089124 [Homalodisca vitripennis]|nr:hypothetical protein J6590_089124 [Homalodisca vitripennis]
MSSLPYLFSENPGQQEEGSDPNGFDTQDPARVTISATSTQEASIQFKQTNIQFKQLTLISRYSLSAKPMSDKHSVELMRVGGQCLQTRNWYNNFGGDFEQL